MTKALLRNLPQRVTKNVRGMVGSAALASLIAGAAAMIPGAAVADATAHSTGTADSGLVGNAPLNLMSTGTAAVYTQATAGGVTKTNQNPEKDGAAVMGPAQKGVNLITKMGAILNFPNGVGDTDMKFTAQGVPATHSFSSVSRAPMNVGNRVASAAEAKYTGTKTGPGKFGSTLKADAEVNILGANLVGNGVAAAQAKDPLFFDPILPGILTLDFALGSTTIQIDPVSSLALPSLSLGSNTASGAVHFDAGASLFGVQFGGIDVNGEILHIVIEGEGIIDGKDDLDIVFRPAAFLGFSLSQIAMVENAIFDALTSFPDGSVGLESGVALAIFGETSLLGPLAFSHSTAPFSFEDTVAAGAAAAAVPIPSMLAPSALGLGLLGWRGRRGGPVHL